MTLPKIILLVGMPASGKSTIGAALATRLGYRFTDTDILIKKQENKSVPAIFAQYGEPYFREKEKQLIPQLATLPNPTVIATGGGLPCFWDNMEQLLQVGTVVFLDTELRTLYQRLLAKQAARPLVAGQSPEQLNRWLTERYNLRVPFYQKAHFRISVTDSERVEEIVTKITDTLTA
ncbi:shikimate kinase [Flexibacter flexilis DSM 6793]|uniref:Shikimate kinase n=1 Tax=Flexibacter flexilis DSM 6793 TaxID=927664 RepID=A0A1I1N3N8_9BACT|nr:shikimate kinase [Flexibacter flexilis]SFC92274.1 shikimate kinase [Flexibacter flexilis DSM 6793]